MDWRTISRVCTEEEVEFGGWRYEGVSYLIIQFYRNAPRVQIHRIRIDPLVAQPIRDECRRSSCSIRYCKATRRDATVKRKRSSTRYIIISIVDFATVRALPSPFPRWIPSARLFEIEQPCRGSCQNSSSPVKTSVFPSKQGTPSSTSPPFVSLKLFHFFSFFLFFHRYIPLVCGFDLTGLRWNFLLEDHRLFVPLVIFRNSTLFIFHAWKYTSKRWK